jgi:hypothetical protein
MPKAIMIMLICTRTTMIMSGMGRRCAPRMVRRRSTPTFLYALGGGKCAKVGGGVGSRDPSARFGRSATASARDDGGVVGRRAALSARGGGGVRGPAASKVRCCEIPRHGSVPAGTSPARDHGGLVRRVWSKRTGSVTNIASRRAPWPSPSGRAAHASRSRRRHSGSG